MFDGFHSFSLQSSQVKVEHQHLKITTPPSILIAFLEWSPHWKRLRPCENRVLRGLELARASANARREGTDPMLMWHERCFFSDRRSSIVRQHESPGSTIQKYPKLITGEHNILNHHPVLQVIKVVIFMSGFSGCCVKPRTWWSPDPDSVQHNRSWFERICFKNRENKQIPL